MPYIQIPLNKEQKEQIIKHCELNNISQNKFIRSLINNYFNNKIVSNDFIKLDKPFYFNVNDLLNNNSVVCSLDKPTSNINNYYVIDKAINNLDKYEINYKTFCTGARNEHKGIIYNCFDLKKNETPLFNYIIFEFKDIPENEKEFFDLNGFYMRNKPILKLSLLNTNELINYIDLKDKEHKQLFNDLKQQEFNFNLTTDLNNYIIQLHSNYNILRPYYIMQLLNNLVCLMQENNGIKNYIETTFKLTIKDINEYLTTLKFNENVYYLLDSLKDNKRQLNINKLVNLNLQGVNNLYDLLNIESEATPENREQ